MPLLVKLPDRFRLFDGAIKVPPLTTKLLRVTTLLPILRVPKPFFVRSRVPEFKIPPRVNVLAETVIIRDAPNVIVPAPKLRLLLPVKIKSPCKLSG